MGDFARVDSVHALKAFRGALCRFAEQVMGGLDEADAAFRRMRIWLQQEQRTFWKGQIPRRAEAVTRAKLELTHKQAQKTPLGGNYSCVEERKALSAAKRRLEEAERKFENVRRWTRQLEQEVFTYKGAVQGVSRSVEQDVPEAVARLDNMLEALDAYASVAKPDEGPSPKHTEAGSDDAA